MRLIVVMPFFFGERFAGFEEFGATALSRPSAEDISALLAMDHICNGWLHEGRGMRCALAGTTLPRGPVAMSAASPGAFGF